MIKLSEIKKSILDLLRDKYGSDYKYYGIKVTEGFSKPSFFVRIIPTVSERETVNITDNVVMAVITYFQKQIEESDILQKIDDIREIMQQKIKVGDRYLDAGDLSPTLIGEDRNIAQITVMIRYKDKVDHAKECMNIEQIKIKKEWSE